ncbi:HAD family hydrolase [Ruminococcaceae bacterium OttesenSCG-928-O06]|nr:HAD family hydrolase [Ruminococcaceae bacterium OttesenSCG-928-O06]
MLFWDFHGTITKPDILWFDAAMEAAAEAVPEAPLNAAVLHRQFSHTCLPWFTIPGGDTRHITGAAWWAYCEGQFAAMFQSCGFTAAQAAAIAPRLREKVLQPHRYHLQPDALFTLKELQRRGYESHILSNNFPELAQMVKALGLVPYFGKVLVSGNVGYDKPRGEIFDAARSVAGQARALWMIGDNPVDDVAGGNAAGFVTVAANGAAAPDAAYQIPNLAGLLELLP